MKNKEKSHRIQFVNEWPDLKLNFSLFRNSKNFSQQSKCPRITKLTYFLRKFLPTDVPIFSVFEKMTKYRSFMFDPHSRLVMQLSA